MLVNFNGKTPALLLGEAFAKFLHILTHNGLYFYNKDPFS
jgi:hypothetical protein